MVDTEHLLGNVHRSSVYRLESSRAENSIHLYEKRTHALLRTYTSKSVWIMCAQGTIPTIVTNVLRTRSRRWPQFPRRFYNLIRVVLQKDTFSILRPVTDRPFEKSRTTFDGCQVSSQTLWALRSLKRSDHRFHIMWYAIASTLCAYLWSRLFSHEYKCL